MSTHWPDSFNWLVLVLVLAHELEHHAEQVHEPFREVARHQVHPHVGLVGNDARLGRRLAVFQGLGSLPWLLRDQPVESSLKPAMYSIRLHGLVDVALALVQPADRVLGFTRTTPPGRLMSEGRPG
jgi:hypothetical protein